MDYPIQPISAIEQQGRDAALAWLSGNGVQPSNPYAEDTGHRRAWHVGMIVAVIERGESPILVMPYNQFVEFVRGGQA